MKNTDRERLKKAQRALQKVSKEHDIVFDVKLTDKASQTVLDEAYELLHDVCYRDTTPPELRKRIEDFLRRVRP